ncbi:MAG: hypothetical protein ABI759_32235 [Candidatus Solibacter sp.]
MSPAQVRFDSWNAERQRLLRHFDRLPIRSAIPYLLDYHQLTGFANATPSDYVMSRVLFSAPERCETLRGGGVSFEELWNMLRGARPE